MSDGLTARLADRLKQLRHERSWSLEDLSSRSGISRASLSRLENADVSATTEVLAKLCSAYALSLSRLLAMVEEDFASLVRKKEQSEWHDKRAGFRRRVVSPPSENLQGEVVSCDLKKNTVLSYDAPSVPGMEHHLYLQNGALEVEIDGQRHSLKAGDCLRYHSYGATQFRTSKSHEAQYVLVLIGG